MDNKKMFSIRPKRNFSILALFVFVFVFSTCHSSADTNWAICYWKDMILTDLPVPAGIIGGNIGDIVITSGGDVYIVGFYSNDSFSSSTACYWKNGVKTDLVPAGIYKSSANSIAITANGDAYIAGYYDNGSIPGMRRRDFFR